MKVIRTQKTALEKSNMSSHKGYVNATYSQLVAVLGEPTFTEPSGDGKTQKEWVVSYKGNVFTIYDWKTFDVNYTMNELDRFNVGGHVTAYDFIDELESKINSL